MNRRQALFWIMTPLLVAACGEARAATVAVVKSPACGCCALWVEHLRANGFQVQVTDSDDLESAARRMGVPNELRSCHTASVDGYAIEGHVPAEDIRRLLAERPDAVGLAVPGMPVGSPGMEQGPPQHFATFIFRRDGRQEVFARH